MTDNVEKRESRTPHYRQAYDGLMSYIERGLIPVGFVLLESPIASYFTMSRMPIRRALQDLCDAGVIHKFHGRGYIVDPDHVHPAPQRGNFQMLDLPSDDLKIQMGQRKYDWERIYNAVSSDVAACFPFGTYRVRENAICQLYDVSRTVVREVLMRLMIRGLIDKDSKSHWIAGPYTAKLNTELYELRQILEPAALYRGAGSFQQSELLDIRERLDNARASSGKKLSLPIFENLEHDLHGRLISRYTNDRLQAVIIQNQLPIKINQMFYRHFGVQADAPALKEHSRVIDLLIRDNPAAASAALENHLIASGKRTLARLKVLAVLPEPKLPSYLERSH